MWSHLTSSKLHQCSTILDQNRQTQASFALTVGCVSIECLWATTSLPYVITSANQNKWQRLKEPIKKRKNGEATYSKRWKTQLTSAFNWLRKWREFWPITNHSKTKVIMHDNPEKLFDTYWSLFYSCRCYQKDKSTYIASTYLGTLHNMWVGLVAVSVLLLLEFPVLWKHDLSPKDSKNNSRPPSIKKNNNRKIFFDVFSKGEKIYRSIFHRLKIDKGGERMNMLQEKEWTGLFQLKRFPLFAPGQMKEPVCLVISIWNCYHHLTFIAAGRSIKQTSCCKNHAFPSALSTLEQSCSTVLLHYLKLMRFISIQKSCVRQRAN